MTDELNNVLKRLRDQQTKWMTPLLRDAADEIDALVKERDVLRKANDSYTYLGRDGKPILAKELEATISKLNKEIDGWIKRVKICEDCG